MKKLKMWYIKLAFGALFFTLLVESVNLIPHTSAIVQNPIATTTSVQSAEIQNQTNTPAIPAEQTVASLPKINQPQDYIYRLSIPVIKVNAKILPMGLTSEGKMAVPNNFTDVGWYSLGAKPGDIGSTVIGAHVDNGGSVNGVFKNLKNVKLGDSIDITDSKGVVFHYVVTDRKIYDRSTQVTQEIFAQNDASRLNLITCYGTWLPKEKTYSSRLVVFAKLQPSAVLTASH